MTAPLAAIMGCAGPALTADEIAFFGQANPWGFILFARNVVDPDQLRALTSALRDAVGRRAPILIDQEGGRVARLRGPHWRNWPAPLETCGLPLLEREIEQALRLRYRIIAGELHDVGVDVNCVPLLDAPTPAADLIIGDRALSRDPTRAASLGHAVRAGLTAGGVLPVVKHIPGHGRATADSHHELPEVFADMSALEDDFIPFKAHADAPMGMTAHVRYDAIDPDHCATMSSACIRLIREEIGFGGLLMTDDISMGALRGPLGTRCTNALQAGCDVILHCNGDLPEMEDIAAASGALSGPALDRAHAVDALPREADDQLAEAIRQYDDLTGEFSHA